MSVTQISMENIPKSASGSDVIKITYSIQIQHILDHFDELEKRFTDECE